MRTGSLIPQSDSKPLDKPPKNLPDRSKIMRDSVATEQATITATIEQKLLVIASDGHEADLPAIQQALDYLGTPYTLYTAAQTPGGLTPDKLTDPANAAHALYQGVILTNGDLAYNGPNGWASALNATEWANLVNFESTFGIRCISWYTYPSPNYGFQYGGPGVDTSSTPLNASFTVTGKPLFDSYVNTANPIPIQNAYTYLATALDATTVPVLTDPSGKLLAATHTVRDATNYPLYDTLALTFDSNAYLTYDLVLAHGLINWVTKGLFLGQRHAVLLAQPDDVFNDNDIWPVGRACGSSVENTGVTYRITGDDFKKLINWQNSLNGSATTKQIKLELPFNGVGTTADFIDSEGNPSGQFSPDTLTPVVKNQQGQFNWINHTYDHENLDNADYDFAVGELTDNNDIATSVGLKNYSTSTMITPDISGLTNPNFLNAAYDTGIRYLVTDTSKVGYNNPTPNAGIYNPFQPGILMIPRHPTNLYYNVTNPDQWLAEDNCLYPATAYGHVSTYAQLLDRESNMMLTYLLKGDMDPLMFHQPNLAAYDGTHSLLGDLINATLAKYTKLVKTPVTSPTELQLGQQMADRMTYNAAGVTAKLVGRTTLVVTAQKATKVPITGLLTSCSTCTIEPYAGQNIAWVTLAAGQSITLTIKNPLPAPTPRLAVTTVKPTTGTTTGGTNVTISGTGFVTGATVTFGTTPSTITKITATAITVKTPAGTAGPVSVTVASNDQTVTVANAFTYTTGTAAASTDDETPAPDPIPVGRTTPPTAGTSPGTGVTPSTAPVPIPTGR